MRRYLQHCGLAFALACAGTSASADIDAGSSLNALPEIAFSQLSQPDQNALGAKALALDSAAWKHGETEHFIYHYQRSFVATPVAVEAEFHFRVVARELGRPDVPWPQKAHIYIFEQPTAWEAFQGVGGLEPWTGGIQSGGSLFIVRNPAYRFTDNSLGHEVAHLVLYRLYGNHIPLWLNEGFAQYVSKGADASYQRARGFLSKPSSRSVAAEKLFPLAALTTMDYPPADQVRTFYDESERLVRFLAASEKTKFLELLELLASGQRLDDALSRTNFPPVAQLEEKFAAYVSKDVASAD